MTMLWSPFLHAAAARQGHLGSCHTLARLMQGPSWSGIDFGGHWRLLMYNVRKLFSPVAVSGTYNITQADALSVYVTNDQPWSVMGESS